MEKNIEEWKDIPNYEGYYQASNLGRVRSLDRNVVDSRGGLRFYEGRIIKGYFKGCGYRQIGVSANGKGRTFSVSQLIAMTFLGHQPDGYTLVVDHINGDKTDDRLENLRIVTHRTNLSTCFRSDRGSFSSNHIGVSWHKRASKWQAQIKFDGKTVSLGLFTDEVESSKAYQSAAARIKDGSFNPDDYKPKWASKYNGVSFDRTSNKWRAQITIGGKQKHIGLFPTELLAHEAYQNKDREFRV